MATEMTPEDTLDALAGGNAPVLETLVQKNLDTLENSDLDARTYFIARAAALVALDAAPVSYLVNLAAASDVLQPGDVRERSSRSLRSSGAHASSQPQATLPAPSASRSPPPSPKSNLDEIPSMAQAKPRPVHPGAVPPIAGGSGKATR